MESGKLYVCPTPIGNLDDITLRTLNVLKEVDLIAAEDTRRSIKILNYFDIKNPLTSYHEHNEESKGEDLIRQILEGKDVAIVSDAGMPGISDPGEVIIKMAIKSEIEVIVLPGATASITALVLSGLPTDKFIFEGFLSSKKRDRIQDLERIKNNPYTSIIYESPYRVVDSLEDMLEVLGDREISLSRELTKRYEETLRGKISEVLNLLDRKDIKGEFVIVISAGEEIESEDESLDIEDLLKENLNMGYSKKESVKRISEEYKLPRNEVYKKSLEL